MTRKHRPLPVLLLTAIVTVVQIAVLGMTTSTAQASVPITQVAKLRDQAPVSGRFEAPYNNYDERVCIVRSCVSKWYRVARGTVATRLNAFVIKEEVRAYDFYLLDVDVDLQNQSGSSKTGWTTIRVRTLANGGTIVDTDDSKSITKDPQDCQSFPVSVGAGWGVASAGIEVGAVTFCDDAASLTHKADGAVSVYSASRIAKIRDLTASRIVKVKRGDKPKFVVTVTVPYDDCTGVVDGGAHAGDCDQYTNHTKSYTYRVGTKG